MNSSRRQRVTTGDNNHFQDKFHTANSIYKFDIVKHVMLGFEH